MNQPIEPTNNGPISYAWLGLLVGFGLIALVVWQNAGDRQGSSNVMELTAATFQTEVSESKVPVVVDFWSPGCGPCLRFAPTMEKLAAAYAGRVTFFKVNVDDQGGLARRFKIDSIPYIVVFKNGQVEQSILGAVSEDAVKRVIDKVLQSS